MSFAIAVLILIVGVTGIVDAGRLDSSLASALLLFAIAVAAVSMMVNAALEMRRSQMPRTQCEAEAMVGETADNFAYTSLVLGAIAMRAPGPWASSP